MKRKYKLKNKRDKYEIEVTLDVIHWVMAEVIIGDEVFTVENRKCIDI